MRRGVCFLVLLLFVRGAAAAQDSPPIDIRTIDPETFRAMALRIPDGLTPDIDGHLDDAVWQMAPVQGQFIQREPHFGLPATQQTEFRVLYDERTLYFGVWVWDSQPEHILASELKRDAGLRKGDQIKIIVDTFHDHRNGYIFFTNPLGALKDAQSVENARTINYDWNVVWRNETSQDDRGWYIEMAIPLSQLRFPTTVGEATWGLNICRILLRTNEESYWVPFPREWGAGGLARVSNAGVLGGLRDLTARRRMEVLPYVLPRAVKDYSSERDIDNDVDLGVDVKVGLTSDLTADFTYKTDFAQVEADQEVVNTTRFNLFFPEKRQFFTESGGVFDYGKSGSSPGGDAAANDPGILALFYSRTIGLVEGQTVRIVGGAKVTGRVGPYAVGVINMTTGDADVRVGSELRHVDRANFTAVRVKRNVLANSTIGGIVLSRQGGLTDYNRAAGADLGLYLGRYFTFTGLVAKTASPGRRGHDIAAVADAIWKTDRFNYGLQYSDIGANVNAEMGFITRQDVRATRAKAAWTPRPRWPGVRQMLLTGTTDYFENHHGRVESRTHGVELQMQRQDTSSASVKVTRDYDYLPTPFAVAGTTLPVGSYAWTAASLAYTSSQAKRVYGNVSVEAGRYYNGDRQTVRGSVNFLIGRTLLFEPNYTRNRIDLPNRPTFVANVLNLRVSQSFSPDLFVKAFFQYNDERRAASMNLLFWYIYRPGSDLYIVYDEGRDTDLTGYRWGRPRSRSLAVKMTYWWSR